MISCTDFGMSTDGTKKISEKVILSRASGTFDYMAPELIEVCFQTLKKKEKIKLNHSLLDSWSLGVMIS